MGDHIMLNKYQAWVKVSRFEKCSLYTAVNRENGAAVFIKKLKREFTWQALLTHSDMLNASRWNYSLLLVEVLKEKDEFYFVFQIPSGYSLSLTSPILKLPLAQFYSFFDQLCQAIHEQQARTPGLYVLPDWIFVHRNSPKFIHHEPFLENNKCEHVFTLNPEQMETQKNEVEGEQRRELVVQLGIIAYRLLTGKSESQMETREEYRDMLGRYRMHCERHIQKIDSKLATFIGKMLGTDVFERPTFTQVRNFTHLHAQSLKKGDHYRPKKVMEVTLEKIQMMDQQPAKPVAQFPHRLCRASKMVSLNRKLKVFLPTERTHPRELPQIKRHPTRLVTEPECRQNAFTPLRFRAMKMVEDYKWV